MTALQQPSATTPPTTPTTGRPDRVPLALLSEVLDVYGASAYVRTADLAGDRAQLRLHHRDGRPLALTPATAGKALTIHRENIAAVVGTLSPYVRARARRPWREIRADAVERYRQQLVTRLRLAGPAVRAFVAQAAPEVTLAEVAITGNVLRPGYFRATEDPRLVLVVDGAVDGAIDEALGARLTVASWAAALGSSLGVARLALTVVRGRRATTETAVEIVPLEGPASSATVAAAA